ncbi:MAG: HEAT repeat domain-containing protein [Planctomycetaceae bacterium]
MSDSNDSATIPESNNPTAPEDLPPVQPPSAGFIMQLFLIPAIIVAAVIGVWVLFGQMAGAEQDWRQLVQDLGSENEHRRWRAASGLAHLLNADRQRSVDQLKNMSDEFAKATGSDQTPALAKTPEVASELVKLMESQLDKPSTKDEDVTHQEFLARTLGTLDLPDVVLPTLRRATETTYNEKVRASALSSIAMVVSRATKQGVKIDSPPLVRTLIDSSTDPSPLVKQFSAYTLGLIPTGEALDHLAALLSDADEMTRVNSAIALARNERTEGFDVFVEVLGESTKKLNTDDLKKMEDAQRVEAMNRYQIEQPMMLNNTLKALADLEETLTPAQKSQLVTLLTPIAAEYEHPQLRNDATQLIKKLK